ncbi:hypothetical protein Tco_0815148 [Tanacetum coccineum]
MIKRLEPNIASSSRIHETEDDSLGGSFHVSPPRFTQASPIGHAPGGAEDHITLSALSSAVSTLVKKVHSLETELSTHEAIYWIDVPSTNVPTTEVPSTDVPTDVPFGVAPMDYFQPFLLSGITTAMPSSTVRLCQLKDMVLLLKTLLNQDLRLSSSIGRERLGLGRCSESTSSRTCRFGKCKDAVSLLLKDANLARADALKTLRRLALDQRKRQQEMVDLCYLSKKRIAEQRAKERRLLAQEVEVEAPSQDVSREKVDAPSHSQNIPEAQVEVPSQEATVEDVEVPSNIASKAQQTASSLKKVGTKKKLLGRKGVHTSQSTIPIEEGDPDAEHKLCIKYASDEDSASDCDTPVHLYAVVDWELLPTGLGSINAIYRLDNSRKYFTSLREILHLVTRADLMTIYGRVMTFYQDKKAEGVGLVLWGDLQILMDSPEVNDGSDFWKNQHTWSIQSWKLYSFSGVHVLETVSGLVIHMFVDKKYPLSINLIERMLDHQLEICHGTVGNELTTAVQLIAFLKKQISDSKRPKVHEWKEKNGNERKLLAKTFLSKMRGNGRKCKGLKGGDIKGGRIKGLTRGDPFDDAYEHLEEQDF